MARKINLILLFGGKSTEHEVSVRSARSIYQALSPSIYTVTPVGITKQGAWVRGDSVNKVLESGVRIDEVKEKTTLLPDPTVKSLLSLAGRKPLKDKEHINVIFPVLHGQYGEDGTMQGLFELANIPYVGCGVLASALGMDKVKQKEVLRQYGIPVVDFLYFKTVTWEKKQKKVLEAIANHFNHYFPLFIKPPNSGSSVGVTKAHNEEELIAGINLAKQYDLKVLIEKGMEGCQEIEVSVLGNDEPKASVCGEILPKAEFYDYDAKYVREDTELQIPAKLDEALSDKVRAMACNAFLALDGSGMARVDFFVNKQTQGVWVNELNTIPGFTSISMYPKLWEYSGLTYPRLVDALVKLAIERWKQKQTIITSK
jgi:D-alanine-D-alanine ligase